MGIAEKQGAIVARYSIIPDLQERLMAATGHTGDVLALGEAERRDDRLVPGCQSRVWIDCRIEDARLRVAMATDAVLVRGLVALIADVYAGSLASEAADFRTTVLSDLGLDRVLSPARRNGASAVAEWIRSKSVGS